MRISIRVDGDDRIGAGHVARCLPVARALARMGHRPRFVGFYTGLAERLLVGEGFECLSPDRSAPAGVTPDQSDAAIIDSYEIPATEICLLASRIPLATLAEAQRCRERGVLIDYHLDRFGERSSERLLAGPAYAPVDPRFAVARSHREDVTRVLVTAGGGAAGERLLRSSVAAVREVFPNAVVLVAGGHGASLGDVESLAQTSRLWDVTDEVDIAVSAAGMTAYELACAGVPAVLVAIAQNQKRVARACVAAGTALALELSDEGFERRLQRELCKLLDPARRVTLATRGVELIDGRGGERIAAELDRRWRQ